MTNYVLQLARRAEYAIPYLKLAAIQGHRDTNELLYEAHRTLATYYRDVVTRKDG